MSVLTAAQDACRIAGLTPPTSLFDDEDQTGQRLLGLANAAGKMLGRKNWPQLIREHTFTTTGADDYALPGGFRSFVLDTAWDRSEYRRARGLTTEQRQDEQSGLVSPTITLQYSLRTSAANSTRFEIVPTAAIGKTVAFEYYSTWWALNSSTQASEFTVNAGTPFFPEDALYYELIWRLLNSMGLPYQEEKAEAQRFASELMAQSGTIEMVSTIGHPRPDLNIPDTGYGT